MYQKVSTDMNFAQREEEVIKFWRDEDIFKKTVKLREGAPAFPPLRSSTARRPPTASRTSAMWRRARSRISSRAIAR